MARYLLPCTCGQKLEVDASQAGLQLTCRCGKGIEVPTLRGLKQLTPVPVTQSAAAAANTASNWGPRQGIIFMGVVVLVCGLLGAGVLAARPPHYQTPEIKHEDFRKSAQDLTLEQSFEAWKVVREHGFSRNLSPQLRDHEERTLWHGRWLAASGVLAACGVVMIGAALASGKRPARKP